VKTATTILLLILLVPGAGFAAAEPGDSSSHALVAAIASSINPVSADYLVAAIEQAEADRAGLIVVELDTPGGLDSSTTGGWIAMPRFTAVSAT